MKRAVSIARSSAPIGVAANTSAMLPVRPSTARSARTSAMTAALGRIASRVPSPRPTGRRSP